MSYSPKPSRPPHTLPPIAALPLYPPIRPSTQTILPRPNYSYDPSPSTPSPDDILAEKRRRNAGASARFRDRRKLRERESQDKCERLEKRIRELEEALVRANATAAAMFASKDGETGAGVRSGSLAGDVHELESLVERMKSEREKLGNRVEELEKENSYLRSLINSCPTPAERSSVPESVASDNEDD